MLGPALKQLFVNLDERIKRKFPVSQFETDVHHELLGMLLTEQFARNVLRVPSDALAGSAAADMPTREVMSGIFGSGPTLNLQVDLSAGASGGSSDTIEVGCGET